MTTPTIYTALAAVMQDVQGVAKRDRNDHQKFMFRGIDAVVNAVGPALRAHGVLVVPQVVSVDYATVNTTTGKATTSCRIVADYVFYAADGSSIQTRVAAEAFDSGDKATPKAMSVAFRTALLQALALPTDEPDPDHDTYERVAAPAGVSAEQFHAAKERMKKCNTLGDLAAVGQEVGKLPLSDEQRAGLRDLYLGVKEQIDFLNAEASAEVSRNAEEAQEALIP